VAAVHTNVPACRVLFISVKPSVARVKKFDDQKKANALVREFCATDRRLGYVDVYIDGAHWTSSRLAQQHRLFRLWRESKN